MVEIFENQAKEIEYYSKRKHTHFIKVDKNGTHIFSDCTCGRCGGAGILPEYGHVDGGVCFACNGSGVREHGATEIKIYTDEYGAKLKAKRAEREAAKRAKLLEESESRRQEWTAREGFNAEGKTWMVLGNTYEIKDELKEKGAKFNYILGWHFDHEVEEYDTLVALIDDIAMIDYKGDLDYNRCWVPEGGDYDYDAIPLSNYMKDLRQHAEDELKNARKLANGEHLSEYIGEVGKRIDFEADLVNHFCFETQGYNMWETETMYIYKFKTAEGDIVVWKTSVFIDEYFQESQKHFKFKATIKEHSEYKGEKQTVISRPKFFTEN